MAAAGERNRRPLVAVIVLRRKLTYWHKEMGSELLSMIETADGKMTATTTAPWLQPHGESFGAGEQFGPTECRRSRATPEIHAGRG